MTSAVTAYVKIIPKAMKHLRKFKWIITFFLIISIVVAFTEGATILLLIPILNSGGDLSAFTNIMIIGPVALWLSSMGQTERLVSVVVVISFVLLTRGIFQLLLTYFSSRIHLEVLTRTSQQSFNLILRADLAYINRRDFATLRTYLYELPINISGAVRALAEGISTIILISIYLVIMLVISLEMTFIALLFIIILGGIIKWCMATPLQKLGKRHADAQVGWGEIIFMALLGSNIIRLANAQPQIKTTYEGSVREYVKAELLRLMLIGLNGPLITTGAGLLICVMIASAAVYYEGSSEPWMVSLIVFILAMYRMMGPASNLISTSVSIAVQFVSFNRLEKFAQEVEAETMANGTEIFTGLNSDIRLQGLDFDYGDARPNDETAGIVAGITLKDLNLTIPKGSMMALVGASGAGKSTLASLLCRLYDPTSGSILINGLDLRKYDVTTWRNHISLVTQDIFLFNDTVLNNIRFGFEGIDIQKVYEAARMAAAIDFIEELPQGWDTQLGEMGVRLSGGQKQRISIARAILNDPKILILDEATSHLDSVTEHTIQQTVDTLAKGRTVIVIAHRLSTVKHADSIVVMDKGRIIEQGGHDELAAKHGAYWRLLQHQTFKQDIADEWTEKS